MTYRDAAFADFAKIVMNISDINRFTYPPVVKQNGPGSDIIALEFWTIDAAREWADYFNVADFTPYEHPVLPVLCVMAAVAHHGWMIQISARERIKKTV